MRFGFEPTQSSYSILRLEGAKCTSNRSTLLFRWSRITCNVIAFLLSSSASSASSQAENYSSEQISMPQFLSEDTAFSVNISMTKLKRKFKEEQPRRTPILVVNSRETSPLVWTRLRLFEYGDCINEMNPSGTLFIEAAPQNGMVDLVKLYYQTKRNRKVGLTKNGPMS